MVSGSPSQLLAQSPVVEARFDDIDELAASPVGWDQEFEQIGRGRFHGELTQLVVGQMQLVRESWSPGVLHRGSAPSGSWAFGLPLVAEGSLHVRRRPAPPGQLLAATSKDDIAFTATGRTELMIVVLPTPLIDRWVQSRRGIDRFDAHLPPRHWQVSSSEMTRRASTLASLLRELTHRPNDVLSGRSLSYVEEKIFDVIFDIIPSAETVEASYSRARIARAVINVLRERLYNPPTITELCLAVGAAERTLYHSCVEAFGRPPATLLGEMRLNAVRRMLLHPGSDTSVAVAAGLYGFSHFGRFAAVYKRQFQETPSTTLAKARA